MKLLISGLSIILAGGIANAEEIKCRKTDPSSTRHLQSCAYLQYPLKVPVQRAIPEPTPPYTT